MNTEEAVVAFAGTIGSFVITAIWFVYHFRHQQRKRELEHIERIKAFEVGRTLPQDEPWLSPTKIGAMIGIIVPIGAFVPAWLASQLAGYHETIWIAAAMVGLAAVICGSILVVSSIKQDANSSELAGTKPYVEEDAYDVVSSRG